ncbi:MAG: Gfo/Idh/MocA family oxidoreductase [Kineosporiaceae bacterium]|nr:Gfo/Idh/MocA family oxidoreductase [Kineosporiaceae bacterium]
MTTEIEVAIVGCGRISDLHARAYLDHPRARLSAICDPDPDVLAARGEAWGVPADRRFTALAELLAVRDLDLVDVCVPHHLHEEVALAVIASGRHLSLQKPMALTLESADRIVTAAEDAGVVLKVFENWVFHEPVQRAKQVIEAGEIGDVLAVRMKSHSGFSPTMWPVPAATQEWRLDPDRCGGGPLVFDDGHHKFATAWYLAGPAQRVYADVGAWQGSAIDSPSVVTWRHGSDCIGILEVVYAPQTLVTTRYYAQDDPVEVTGTAGTLWIRGGHGRLLDAPALSVYRDGRVVDHHGLQTDWGMSFRASGMAFVDVLLDGGTPCLTGREGREVLAFALAAQESARRGRPVDPL